MIQRSCARRVKRFVTAFVVMSAFSAIASGDPPPEGHYVLRAPGGVLNGEPIDAEHYEITVVPGEQITGSIVVQTANVMPPTSVAPLGGTVDWGDRETQPWLTNGWIASGTHIYTVNVNKFASMTPGDYHIIVAFGGEFDMAQVMSATNWATYPDRRAVWDDGNDLGFDWSPSDFEAALFDGIVPMLQLTSQGYVESWRPATAVVVHVTGDCNGNGIPDDQDIVDGTSDDCDGNGRPDECQPDADTDGVIDACDNCPGAWNPGQEDGDGDGLGDACHNAPPEPRGWQRYNYNWDNTRFYPYGTVDQLAFSELSVRWSRAADSVVTGNVDGDDQLELAVVSGTTLSVLESDGTTAWSTPLPNLGANFVLDDVNADGKLDVLVSVKSSPDTHEIRAYRGYDGELLQTISLPIEGNESLALYGAIDLDDDGDLEVLTTLKSGYGLHRRGVWVFDYETATEAWHYEIGPQPGDAVVADIDGDGVLEILLGQASFHNTNSANGFSDSSAWLFVFNGTGGLRCATPFGNWVVRPSRADIDQDGDEEVIGFRGGDYYGGNLAVCEIDANDCSISTCWEGPYDVDPLGRSIGDVRAEPGLEIVIGGKDQVRILGSDFTLLAGKNLGPEPNYVRAISDVNGDGANEIYVSVGSNLYAVDGDLNTMWSRSFPNNISDVIISDLDADGATEILVKEGGSVHIMGSQHSSDFRYRCVVVAQPSEADQASTLPIGIDTVDVGRPFLVEYWAEDSGTTNSGIVSAYVDLDHPEDFVTCYGPESSPLFSLFPGGECDGLIVDELGGSQLDPGIGVEPGWARVAIGEFTADVIGQADFVLEPATTESSAHGRGVIPISDIDYGTCTVEVVCPCIYDLDDNCNIAGGDLGLFAPCWSCCEGEPCWEENGCEEKDFDCSGCVSGGDLGWFAGAWQKTCDEIDPIADYPAYRQCDGPAYCPGGASAGGGVASQFASDIGHVADAEEVVLLSLRFQRLLDQGRIPRRLDASVLGFVGAGERVFAEVWAKDTSPTTNGLTAVFTDLRFDPSEFEVVSIDAGETFTLFSDPSIELNVGVVLGLGGATMDSGHGANAWTRVGVVELEALTDVVRPTVTLRPSHGEAVSRYGQGLVRGEQIRVLHNDLKKVKSRTDGLRDRVTSD